VAFKGVFMEPLFPNTAEAWLLGISPEGIGAVGMVLNFAVALSVSAVTAPPSPATQALVENLRIPRGADQAKAH
jgi:cation/acetate symporter